MSNVVQTGRLPEQAGSGSATRRTSSSSRLTPIARATIGLEVFLSIGALAGGLALMLGPRGEILPLPVSSLADSPFSTYFLPGLILFGVLGLGPIVAAWLAWIRHPLAPLAALVTGLGLLIWLIVEIAIVGYTSDPPLQPFYLVLGVAIVGAAVRWSGLGSAARLRADRKAGL
jgi:hypothetical protein